MRRIVRAVVLLASLAAVLYGASALHALEQRLLFLEGVRVPGGDPEPFVRARARDWYETEVTLDAGSSVVRASRRELGAHVDVEAALASVRAARGSAPIWERVWAAVDPPDQFEFTRELREDEARAFLEDLRRRVAIEPEAVRRDGTGGRPGLTIDLIGATSAMNEAIASDRLLVRVPVRRIEAPSRPV